MTAEKRAPSYAQRIALNVLANGGFVDPGQPDRSCPRLYYADARLFALIPRQTLDVLRRRFWLETTAGPTGRPRYIASLAGRQTSKAFRP